MKKKLLLLLLVTNVTMYAQFEPVPIGGYCEIRSVNHSPRIFLQDDYGDIPDEQRCGNRVSFKIKDDAFQYYDALTYNIKIYDTSKNNLLVAEENKDSKNYYSYSSNFYSYSVSIKNFTYDPNQANNLKALITAYETHNCSYNFNGVLYTIVNIIPSMTKTAFVKTHCDYTGNGGGVDTDGDGVLDSEDICPGFDDTADSDGDGVPDGCDTVAGVNKPDLEITNFNFQSSANQTAGQGYFNINNDAGSYIYSTLDVKNSGNKNAGQFNFQIYLSKSSTFSTSPNTSILVNTTNIGLLNIGSIKSLSNNISISNYIYYFDLNGYYYFHFVVDKDSNQVEESNENNNVKTQKVYYTKTTFNRPPKDLLIQMRPIINNESDILDEPYTVQVYNFSNIKILEQTVINKDGESIIIKNLPIGLYIIKSKYGSRKIHVQY